MRAWLGGALPQLRKRWFLGFFGAILFVWGCYYVLEYPGIFVQDASGQINTVLSGSYDNWAPIAHTLLLGALYRLAGDNIQLFIAVQMLLVAFVAAYAVWWIATRTRSRWLTGCAWGWFVLHPLFAFISFSTPKDAMFSAAFLLLVIELAELAWRKDTAESSRLRWLHILSLCLAVLGTLFFRNNGAFVVLLLLPLGLWLLPQRRRKFILTGICASEIALFAFAQSVLLPAFHVRQTPVTEGLALPLQQIGRVIAKERPLAPEEEAALAEILPLDVWRAKYSSLTVDPVKFDAAFNGDAVEVDKQGFMRLWGKLLLRYPGDYIAATLGETRLLWDITAEPGMLEEFYNSSVHTHIRRKTPFPALQELEYKLINIWMLSRYTIPFHIVWNPPVCFAVCGVMMVRILLRRQKRLLLPFIPVVGLWISLFLTIPHGAVGRYVWPVFCAVPLLFSIGARVRKYQSEERKLEAAT
ncbi:MAG: DUF6020 family protein [Oscillospiraceae bacterium]|nr:DUF6020 family protein [Oscillospiraceae bacterium]